MTGRIFLVESAGANFNGHIILRNPSLEGWRFFEQDNHMKDLRSFATTFCQLMNIKAPQGATSEVFEELLLKQPRSQIQKALIYCPDAFGWHAFKKYPAMYKKMQSITTDEVALHSIYPSVTPVCFASLFSGLSPEQHGIDSYKKPILKCETIFDQLISAGKKVALVSVKDSSVDQIFKDRKMDYFSMDYDPLVTAQALELLKLNQHDVIIVYHQEYDDLLHATGPFSQIAEWALQRHVDSFKLLSESAKAVWKTNYFIAFTPDHGGHVDPVTGFGTHGDSLDEDMQLRHFFIRK